MGDFSIVEYFAEHEGYRCGYCKSPDTNYSHGMWAHSLGVRDYQDLIDRGWRRSGKYCYKPTMNVTCCPMYTIKCSALNFKLTKSQKKIVKKVNKFLIHGKKAEFINTSAESPDQEFNDICDIPDAAIQKFSSKAKESLDEKCLKKSSKPKVSIKTDEKNVSLAPVVDRKCTSLPMDTSSQSLSSTLVSQTPKKGLGADPSLPQCKKAKEIRQDKKRQKLMQRAAQGKITPDKLQELLILKKKVSEPKSLEDILSEADVDNAVHRLRLKLIRSDIRKLECEGRMEEVLQVYQAYQTTIHNDPPEKCSQKQFNRFLVNGPFKVRLVRSSSEEFEKKHVPTEFPLYQVYQMNIHKDKSEDCKKTGFCDFLVTSPLTDEAAGSGGPPHGYGSYHQQYWIDDKLIAVGVIDLLPYCISSVYFFYDPEYSFLSLGTYAAIREIAFTREMSKLCTELQFYYMGFYIHSCPKMKYKAHFGQSSLLCPETFCWVPYEKCVPKLDTSKYARLDEDTSKVDVNGDVDTAKILILHNRRVKRYPVYAQSTSNEDVEEVTQYASLVGKTCYQRMLLFRN